LERSPGVKFCRTSKEFFESGGDSIWASQLLSRIRDRLKIEVPLSTLYRAPSLAQFTEEIKKLKPVITTGISRKGPQK
jgi:acyl carrier protein